ncbi:MAG: hypothetical protein LBI43_04690 [Streptococcaceae bacterium]|nr:hypothetical protein [Streptococcaceae bacterium]
MSYFVDKESWHLGWDLKEDTSGYQRAIKAFDQIQIGDIVVAKQTGVYEQETKILAVGFVKKIIQNGHDLNGNWVKNFYSHPKVYSGQAQLSTVVKLNPETASSLELIEFAQDLLVGKEK